MKAARIALCVLAFASTGPECFAQGPAAPPAAAPQRPAIAVTKVEGTDNVYIFRNVGHQSMFVVTSEGVIATDPIAYGRPNGGQQYLDEIRKVTDKPVKYVIYSHGHFDHAAGGKAFKDAGATFVAHKRVAEHWAVVQDPFTVMPDETFGDEGRTIKLGGTTLELLYLGPNHSDNNIVMRLPKERIVFLVDTIPVGTFAAAAFYDYNPLGSEKFIQKVIDLDWDRLIPGHPGVGDRLGTKDDARAQLAILQEASAEVKKMAREGKCYPAAENELKLPKYESWPGYATALPALARTYCRLWGRGVSD